MIQMVYKHHQISQLGKYGDQSAIICFQEEHIMLPANATWRPDHVGHNVFRF